MLKITTAINNRIPTANLIFRNEDNKGVNLIYFPEYPNQGANFINLYRKKNYWDYNVVPAAFTFLGKKVLTNNYFKTLRTKIPQLRTQRKFLKVNKEMQSSVVDLTPLSEEFSSFIKTRSRKQTIETFFELVNSLAVDSLNTTGKKAYLIIDSNNTDEKSLAEALFYLSRLNGNRFRGYSIEGIIAYGNNRFWPLTINDKDNSGEFFKLNTNIMNRFFKEVHSFEAEQAPVDKDEEIKTTRKEVQALYDLHQSSKKKATSVVQSDISKKDEELAENPLETIRHIVNGNPYLKGKNLENKLHNLFELTDKEKVEKELKKQEIPAGLTKKDQKIISDIDKDIKKLNQKYNGVINVDANVVNKTADNYYDPINIIGFNDFHAYNRQSTEFDENLDEAMVDLIKSLEKDKTLNIKVLSIKPVITDTFKDRFKTFKIKIQHKDFGHTKPYTVQFHVPYPAQGKYLKIGGNNFIATNQFFPRPVLKVKPNMVRVYTHYSTVAITLKGHTISESVDFAKLTDDFAKKLRSAKKLERPEEKIDKEEAQFIIDKYGLPANMNPDLLINMEIK